VYAATKCFAYYETVFNLISAVCSRVGEFYNWGTTHVDKFEKSS